MTITSRTKACENDNNLSDEMKLEIQVEVQKEIKTLRLAIHCIHEELLKMQLEHKIEVGGYSFLLTYD